MRRRSCFRAAARRAAASVTYRRFDTAAEALRFAVEEMPSAALLGAYLEVDEARFGVQEIRSSTTAPPIRWRGRRMPS